MKRPIRLSAVGFVMLACASAFGETPVDSNQSSEVIKELLAHLPKGSIKTGKQLPPFVKTAVKELARLSAEKPDLEFLFAHLAVLPNMDRYLDFNKVADREQRKLIKRWIAAFTIDHQWPVFINGESELYVRAMEAERVTTDNPAVYKLAAILWHEMVHAKGQPDEAAALAEEINMLERMYGKALVDMDWLNSRKAKLAQVEKGELSRGPMVLKTSNP